MKTRNVFAFLLTFVMLLSLAACGAAAFSEETFGAAMPCSRPNCGYSLQNTECIRERCPFFPKRKV